MWSQKRNRWGRIRLQEKRGIFWSIHGAKHLYIQSTRDPLGKSMRSYYYPLIDKRTDLQRQYVVPNVLQLVSQGVGI